MRVRSSRFSDTARLDKFFDHTGYGQVPKDKDDEIDLGKVVADWQAMLEETKPPSLSNPSVLEVGPKE